MANDLLGKAIFQYTENLKKLARTLESPTEAAVNIKENDWFGILFSGDWHLEHIHSDTESLERDLKLIGETEHLYWIYCGDGGDWHNIALTHLGGEYENLLPPQMTRLVHEYLLSLASRKLIAAVAGNHDLWVQRVTDFDYIFQVMKKLKVKYLGSGGILKISAKKRKWECIILHKAKGHSIYNPFHANMRLVRFQYPQADMVVIAHSHLNACAIDYIFDKPVFLARTSSYLSRSRWAQAEGFTPSRISLCPWVIIHPGKPDMLCGQGVELAVQTIRVLRVCPKCLLKSLVSTGPFTP